MLETIKQQRRLTAPIVIVSMILSIYLSGSVFAIARGYVTTDAELKPGMVAALSETGDSRVQRADQNSTKRIVGIVTTVDNSSVTLASGDSKILIETEGQIKAYVSDVAGSIKNGDTLVLSPFKGILMKGSESSGGVIIGAAAQDASSAPQSDGFSFKYKEAGADKTTQIVPITIDFVRQGSSAGASVEPSPLAKIGQSITGRQVSDIRVLIALIIFVLVLIAEGGIIYGAVTSAVTALGRNPMARKIIRREMFRIIFVAIIVLAIGLGAVYGILFY